MATAKNLRRERERVEELERCKAVDVELYRRVNTPYEQVLLLPTLELPTSHVITCRSRPGQQADPESDGEDIPDPPIIRCAPEASAGHPEGWHQRIR